MFRIAVSAHDSVRGRNVAPELVLQNGSCPGMGHHDDGITELPAACGLFSTKNRQFQRFVVLVGVQNSLPELLEAASSTLEGRAGCSLAFSLLKFGGKKQTPQAGTARSPVLYGWQMGAGEAFLVSLAASAEAGAWHNLT